MNAYSHLKQLLKQQQLSVPELYRRIQGNGIKVNVKSLYRLNDENHPVERLDMRVAGAICRVCEVPLSEWIVFEEDLPSLLTLDSQKQERLNLLMSKNNEVLLSGEEYEELKTLVTETETITLSNARLLASHRQRLEDRVTGRVGSLSRGV